MCSCVYMCIVVVIEINKSLHHVMSLEETDYHKTESETGNQPLIIIINYYYY